jgi:hypothetical protein
MMAVLCKRVIDGQYGERRFGMAIVITAAGACLRACSITCVPGCIPTRFLRGARMEEPRSRMEAHVLVCSARAASSSLAPTLPSSFMLNEAGYFEVN